MDVSARDDLLSLLYGDRPEGLGAMPYGREEDADQILARHAHELAEKIRAHAVATAKPGSVGYAGIVTGADLIDPEAGS